MRLFRNIFPLAVASMLSVASVGRGATIASDGFIYTAPGGLNGQNGGTGFAPNAWAAVSGQADPALAAGSLTYSDGTRTLSTSGNKVAPANTSRSTRNLDATEPVANRTLWVSFRINYTVAGGLPTNHAGFSLFSATSGGGSELFIGKPGNATNWGLDTSSQNFVQATGAIADANKDAFLLTRIAYGATTANVDLWVNPPLLESGLGAPQVSSTESNFDIVSMRVSTGANSTGYQFDEFRRADTFAEVIPEPSGCALGLAGVGLLVGRRRRH